MPGTESTRSATLARDAFKLCLYHREPKHPRADHLIPYGRPRTGNASPLSATVIVLDGAQRAALAVVRSLGERGLRVVVAADTERSIAGASRWCAQTAALPSPDRDADAFVSALEALAKRETAALVFPITDASLTALQGRAQ